MKKLPPLILAAIIAIIACSDKTPTESHAPAAPDTIRDTIFDTLVDTVYLSITDTLTVVDTVLMTDTLYIRDTVDYAAIDLFTVGYDFAKQGIIDQATSGGLHFIGNGVCTWRAQIHSSYGCDFLKVYGHLYTTGGNIPRGDKYFTAWIRYDGEGATSDTANWELFDMEWR